MGSSVDQSVLLDPALRRFRTAVSAVYGERLDRVVLFGSRARGDARPDSDYDVAVFIHNPESRWNEIGRLAEITTAIMVDSDAYISAKPFRAEAYNDLTPFMREIRRDGLDL